MMPLWIALYFVLACALGAWMALPAWRSAARRQVVRLMTVLMTPSASLPSPRAVSRGQGVAWRWSGPALAVGVLACLAGPSWLLWRWHAGQALVMPGFDAPVQAPPVVVSALLQGEHLVPPPPLPPALFSTPEVRQWRPDLAMADRRWEQFKPDFRQRLLSVYQAMKTEHGYDMVLLEGYRSPERQAMLAQLGPSVTNAGAWQSYHQHGLAADSAFLRDGKLVISERDPWAQRGYALYGQLAERAGLVWGGRWRNADLGHVELRSGAGMSPAGRP